MIEAFEQSAVRHWRDADLLKKEGRHSNANQLVGFAAECAIKAALTQLPAVAPGGVLATYYHAHIDKLWGRVHVQGLQKRFPGLMAVLKQENHFNDWSTDQRYAPDGTVSEEASNRHQLWAKRILASVGINGTRAGS